MFLCLYDKKSLEIVFRGKHISLSIFLLKNLQKMLKTAIATSNEKVLNSFIVKK